MIKKKYIVMALSALACASHSFAQSYSSTDVIASLDTAIQTARTITPVPTTSSTASTIPTTNSASYGVQDLSDSSEAMKHQIGTTTKLFGANTTVSSAGTQAAAITIVATTPTTPTAPTAPVAGVQAVCGAENFDDVVKSTFGTVDLTKDYTDSMGKVCRLSTKRKECKYAYGTPTLFSSPSPKPLFYIGSAECLVPELKQWVISGNFYDTMKLHYSSYGGNSGGGTSKYCRGEGRIGSDYLSREATCEISGTNVWYK
jgi:hypothetical protein